MPFRLEFYRTVAGSEPALEYIRAQVKSHRAKIGRALQYLEDTGHLARRPQVDYLGNDIYELRVAIDQHQHRLLYFFHGRSVIVVTSGLLKNEGKKGRGTTLRQYLRGEMKDPEFRRLYEEADIELRVALEITKAREARKMSQRELAEALKTKQQTVSRIERGAQNVTIQTLDRIARVLGRGLQVRFVPADGA